MSELRWEEPPIAKQGIVHDWPKIVAELVEHPGEWAIATVCLNQVVAAQVARAMRVKNYAAFKLVPGRFEAKSRSVQGEARVYARYLPSD